MTAMSPEAAELVGRLLGRCDFPPPGSPVELAVSGGADSSAMLVLAVAAGCRATAYHVDHGLRPSSAQEASVVERLAAERGAGFVAVTIEVPAGPNLEARARTARYAALPPGVATGHTADDQAETILINLLRGAGRRGLGGMVAGRRHPILGLRRSETVALCSALGLEVVEDETNRDPAILRNRVRHELLPLLEDLGRRDPVPVLVRQGALLAEEDVLLDRLAGSVDPADAAGLAALDPVLARRAVRAWLREQDEEGHPPSAAAVERVLEVARKERRGCEVSGGLRVRRREGRLRLESARTAPVPRDSGTPPK